MREFIIEITDRVQDSELEALTQPSIIHKAGIAGEHKASRLVFCLPESWDSEWTYVVECVNSMGEGTPSEKLSVVEKDGKRTVNFDIPRSMTEMGSGDYVLEAILYDGEEVAKIIRSATVRVGIEKSPTFKKRVVDAIRGIYEELIAKLETIINRFNNGEFNGATFTPSVSVSGDLSWSNDKDLANPETVNIKGEKGDKGDKGDDGKNGEDGKDGKDGEGKDIPIVFALPEDAKDGDMCLLASIDGIPGKTVKLDWDNLMLAAKSNEGDGFALSFYMEEEPVGEFAGFHMERDNRTSFQFYNENLNYVIELVNGEIDTDISTVTELPEYFTLPYFDRAEGLQYGIALNWFSVPLRLMIYNGEWNDSGLTPEQLKALNANTAARHTHDNIDVLNQLTPDSFGNTKVIVENTAVSFSGSLRSDKYYIFVNPATKIAILSFLNVGSASVVPEYIFEFKCGDTATRLSLPHDCVWSNNDVPNIRPNRKYIIRVVDNVASYSEVRL